MDVPILTAVISVAGTLLGTIVGGRLTTYTNLFLNRRREQAEFRIGCRLIAAELYENEACIDTMIETKRWWASELAPEMKAWEEHQKVFAAYLSDQAWLYLRNGIMAVHLAHHF